jgi:hypothetical protein
MKRAALLVIILTAAVRPLQAQATQYNPDAEVRAHFNLETKLTRKWSLHLDQQYRFGNNVSQLTRGSADLGLGYKVNRHIRLVADYRYMQSWKNAGYYATRHWYSGAVVLRTGIDRWKFIYRNLVQFRNGDVNSDERYQTKIYDRNRLSVRYEATKRWTFYTSHEAYVPLNNPQTKGIDRTRHSGGTLFNTFKNQQLEFYFMFQQEWQKGGWWDQSDKYPNPYFNRDFIYGIGYSIEI